MLPAYVQEHSYVGYLPMYRSFIM